MDEQQSTDAASPTLVNHAIKNGVILGIISLLLVVVIYAIDFAFMASFKFLGLVLVIGLGYVIYSGISYRNEIGGFLPYGKAFMHGFVVLAVSGLISTAFNILLYHVVDPELPQKLTEAIIRNTEETMASFGMAQEGIDQATASMRTDMPDQFSIGGLAFGFVKALIWYCIIALITALFVKKNVPLEG